MPDQARAAEDDDRDPFQDQQAAEGDDEGGHLEAGDQGPLEGADGRADQQGGDDRQPTTAVDAGRRRLHQFAHDHGPEPHDQADGEVDLAEQQGEDLGHRQHHEHRALLEQVDQVLCREETAGCRSGR